MLAGEEKWIALGVLAAATLAIDAIYLSPRRAIPLKFLIPGTVFLIAFQIVPIIYNVNVGFTNWSTGHILVEERGDRRDPAQLARAAGRRHVVRDGAGPRRGRRPRAPARRRGDGKRYVGTKDELQPLDKGALKLGEFGTIESAEGYEIVKGADLLALDKELASFTVPTDGAARSAPRAPRPRSSWRRRSATAASTTRSRGSRTARSSATTARARSSPPSGEELEPGLATNIGLANFSAVLSDPLIREPFLRVLRLDVRLRAPRSS